MRAFLRWVLRRRTVERQMEEELQEAVAQRADDLVARGLPPAEAERRARAELGSLADVKDAMRDGSPSAMALDGWGKDLRHAARRVARAPGFTAVAVLMLALGIGGTSAIFTVVKTVLLDPLPYADGERLVLLWNALGGTGSAHSPLSGFELAEIRKRVRTLDGLGAIWAGNGTLHGDGDPEQLKVGFVTGDFLPVLGARPLLGRTLRPDDEGAGRPPVVVLGHGLWQRRFGGDPGVVGRTVRLDGVATTVVGVMPPGFRMVFPPESRVPEEVQVWTAFGEDLAAGPRDLYFLRVVGRLAPGASAAAAGDELAAIGRRLGADFNEFGRDITALGAAPLHGDAVRAIRPALLALFAGVGLVLAIVCVNIASLLLARGGARRAEMTVRAALGASRARLVRQLVLESLVLAACGGALGLLVGQLGLEELVALAPTGLLPPGRLGLDGGVLAFAALATLAAGLGFGVAPALAVARVDLAGALRGAATVTGGRRRARAALVVAEVALSFVLLVGAGLMIRTFAAVQAVDPGPRPDGVLTFELSLPDGRYRDDAAHAAFARELTARLRALPGVDSVGAISHLPLDDYPNWYSPYAPVDDERDRDLMADHRAATPDYLRAVGATLVRGRFFTDDDEAAGRQVVVIDEKLADEAWPGGDAIGRTLDCEKRIEGQFHGRPAEVVGVVRHIPQQDLTRQLRGQIYIPYAQSPREHLSFVVRGAGDLLLRVADVRRTVAALDSQLAIAKVWPLGAYLERAARPARFTMVLASIFAGLALALSAIGLYGVIASSVSQRRRELGIRLVLGAEPGQLVREVVREGVFLAVAGLALGLLAAAAAGPLLATLLFGVGAGDPPTFLASALLLPVTAIAAAWLPARRAGRESPMAALRVE